MSQKLVVTLTVPLPDGLLKMAAKVMAADKAIQLLTDEMEACLPGEYTIVTETVKDKKTRGPRAKKATSGDPFDEGHGVAGRRATA